MRHIGIGFKDSTVAQDPPDNYRYLLDEYPDGCCYAYAFRKLRSTYTGPCCRVRRSSDNEELDFGWVGNGLDEDAVISWVGSGVNDIGYLVRLYQQGTLYPNDHGSQATVNAQPVLVNAGEIQKSDGKVIVFNQALGQNRALLTPARAWSGTGGISTAAVTGVSPMHFVTFFRWLTNTTSGTRSVLRRGSSAARITAVRLFHDANPAFIVAHTADSSTALGDLNCNFIFDAQYWQMLRLMTVYKHEITGRGFVRLEGAPKVASVTEEHLTGSNPGTHAICLGSETGTGTNSISAWNIFVHYLASDSAAIPDMEEILMQDI